MGAEPMGWRSWGGWRVLALLVGAAGAIGSWWLAGRAWLAYHRPELIGYGRYGDSGPDPTLLVVAAVLLLVGIACAAALVVVPRGPSRSRWIVPGVVAVGLIVAVTTIVAMSSDDPRCSRDSYSGSFRCATGGEARAADVRMLLVPGLVTLACLAVGARLERRRSTAPERP